MLLRSDKMVLQPLHLSQRKEKNVKTFDITLNKTPPHRYHPGDEISGTVHLEIRHPLEICFLEFTVYGYAMACAVHAQQGLSFSRKETYIKKQMVVLGSADGITSTVIIPGRYNSRFSFRLPKNLPSSSMFEDKKGSLTFHVRYFVQARLCDEIIATTLRGSSKRRTIIKVLMSRHLDFYVERPFDISSVPMATWPTSHTEDVVLGCGPFDMDKSSMTATLDRSVYHAGETISIKFDTDVAHVKSFKSLRCDLRQRVELKKTAEVMHFVSTTTTVKDPSWKIERMESKRPVASLKVSLQTSRHIIPSFLDGCNLLKVTYNVRISVLLVNQAARMTFEVPLFIAPSKHFPAERAVPIFNRPMRFPCFSDSQHIVYSSDSSGEPSNPSNRSSQHSDAGTSRQVLVSVHV